jgi:putative transposase
VLKKHTAGLSAGNVCRKYEISDATFYKWRSRYGGMEVSDARKLKALEDENRLAIPNLAVPRHRHGPLPPSRPRRRPCDPSHLDQKVPCRCR